MPASSAADWRGARSYSPSARFDLSSSWKSRRLRPIVRLVLGCTKRGWKLPPACPQQSRQWQTAARCRRRRRRKCPVFQPVRDVLNVGGSVLGLDGFFHRDDVHTDACAARGHHGGDVLQRQERHPLKEGCHLGVVGDLPLVHVEKLCAAGHEHRQDVLLFAAGILPVVLQQILCRCSVLFSAPSPLGLRPQARVEAQPPQAALSAKTEGGPAAG